MTTIQTIDFVRQQILMRCGGPHTDSLIKFDDLAHIIVKNEQQLTSLQQQNERLVAAYVKIMEWAIVPIESLQDLGTPGKVVGFRCVLCNHDCELGQELIHDSGCPIPLQFLTPPTTPAGNEK